MTNEFRFVRSIRLFFCCSETLNLETPFVDVMLSELKYLNIVEHGDIVSLKIFQMFDVATANYQQIIVKSLPDIIEVSRHNEVMAKLM